MRTRPKDLGTWLETHIVNRAQDRGLIAERLPEGGARDRGDVRLLTDVEWVIEAKNRMNLNVPRSLDKALVKSGTPTTAVVWRKLVRQEGHTRRTADGPITVSLTLDTFLDLLAQTTDRKETP